MTDVTQCLFCSGAGYTRAGQAGKGEGEMITTKTIGETFRYHRNKNGMKLWEVSAQSGLSVSFLSDLERGRAQPSLATIEKLCTVYDCPLVVKFGRPFKYGGEL